MCVHGTHCVLARAHMCVPTGHVFVFQEDTCLLADERVCVCVSAPRAHVCVFICTHMCVPHVHICEFMCPHMFVPIGHVFVFQVNTCLFSDERTCVCVCVPGAHIYIHMCVFTCTHMCVHVYTRLCSN